jgi:hypothetical protein
MNQASVAAREKSDRVQVSSIHALARVILKKAAFSTKKGVDNVSCHDLGWRASAVERIGSNKTWPVQSKLGDQLDGATRRAAKPEKSGCVARFSRGLGPRKR